MGGFIFARHFAVFIKESKIRVSPVIVDIIVALLIKHHDAISAFDQESYALDIIGLLLLAST